MSDFVTKKAKPSGGDRTSFLDDAAGVGYEPSDIPGYVHPAGNKKLYLKSDDPEAAPVSRGQALASTKKGGALY